jgi:hypothetical protein
MDQNIGEDIAGMKVFSNPEDLAASINEPTVETAEQPTEQVEAVPEVDPAPQVEEQTQEVESTQYVDPEAAPVSGESESEEWSEGEVENAVFSYLSERLGREVTSLDDFNTTQQTALDERVEAIARFVEETGRAPQDWFAYQSLNPSEMDDVTAVRVDMASSYPNLSAEELNLLIESKYKTDPNLNSEEEVRLSQVQLKVDAENARKNIEEIRNSYMAPEQTASTQEEESIIDENWIAEMSREVDALEGLEFDLGGDRSFTFSLNDGYKSELKTKNARLDEYFDPYVREDGSWDYDKLSSHRAVIDNIDSIVASAYKQGMGDGQKGLVQRAANVQTQAPAETGMNQSDPVVDQLKQIIGAGDKMTFKI